MADLDTNVGKVKPLARLKAPTSKNLFAFSQPLISAADHRSPIKSRHNANFEDELTMQPTWQRYYDSIIVIASRGIGWVILSALFAIKKYFLPADQFASMGYAFAAAGVFVSPIASPIFMMISRRIIQARDLGRDRNVVLLWGGGSFALAILSAGDNISNNNNISDGAMMVSVVAFMLASSLNTQYVIWMNEAGQTARSIILFSLLLLAVPASILVRYLLGISQIDRSFSVEAALFILPALIITLFTHSSNKPAIDHLYKFSIGNYAKYFVSIFFYTGILWTDWHFGQAYLSKSVYFAWAETRILFERILLPFMNVLSASLLWRLLRSSTALNQQEAQAISSENSRKFGLILIGVALASIGIWLSALSSIASGAMLMLVGYLAFGLTSIFLEFYQAKFTLAYLTASLLLITVIRGTLYLSIASIFGVSGVNIFWALSSIGILFFVYYRSSDQIKFRSA